MSQYRVPGRSLTIVGCCLMSVLLIAVWRAPSSAEEPPPPRSALKRVTPDGADPGGWSFVQVFELTGFSGPAYSLAWSPDGSVVASAAFGMVMIWDPATAEVAAVLRGHQDFVWGVAWSPDGRTLASASADGTVKLWRRSDYAEVASLSTGWAMCATWSPDGGRLAVGTSGGTVQIWDVPGLTIVRQIRAPTLVVSAVWSGDGLTLAVGDLAGGITLWDPESGARIDEFETTVGTRDTNGLAWSPDDSMLASAHQDGSVWVWDAATGQVIRTLQAHGGWARGVAFSPDSRLLVSTGENARAHVWSAETWDSVDQLLCPALPLWSVSWSPDGDRFAVGSGRYDSHHGGTIFVWEVIEGPPTS
jgi:WD40 repeat protein